MPTAVAMDMTTTATATDMTTMALTTETMKTTTMTTPMYRTTVELTKATTKQATAKRATTKRVTKMKKKTGDSSHDDRPLIGRLFIRPCAINAWQTRVLRYTLAFALILRPYASTPWCKFDTMRS